ncbi:hypothetical protein ACRAWC_03260 [Leifsonia sp. L25]|uniref:hypothetical protein n=1 Tax=Actinomycetes TaxID=1760 RepID=UPI003D69704A
MTPEAGSIPIPLPVDTGSSLTDWLMVVVSLLGVLVSGAIAYLAYRANVASGAAQVAATEALAKAANASEAATKSQLALLERSAHASTGATWGDAPAAASEGDAATKAVHWEVRRIGKFPGLLRSDDGYELRNEGGATARDVRIEGLTDLDKADVSVSKVEPIGPGESAEVRVHRGVASPPAAVVVVEWWEDNQLQRQREILVLLA